MKIVISPELGGFYLTYHQIERYCELKGIPRKDYHKCGNHEDRTDPDLIRAVQEFPDEMQKVIDLPDGINYEIISSMEGEETIVEVGHFWR